MPVLLLAEVEVYPEYLDAELMIFERLRTLYASQRGCRSVRLLKDFDVATSFALCTEWDEPEAPLEAMKAWAESDVVEDALSIVVGTPNLHTYHVLAQLGNTIGSLEPGSVAVCVIAMASPGMRVEVLKKLEALTDGLVAEPGFLGSLVLHDAVVEERVGVLHLWRNYRSFRPYKLRVGKQKHRVFELIM